MNRSKEICSILVCTQSIASNMPSAKLRMIPSGDLPTKGAFIVLATMASHAAVSKSLLLTMY